MTATSPLPAHSRKLAVRRYEVNISRPHPTRERSRIVHCTGRFATERAARAWAEQERQQGDHAGLTLYAACDGWTAHAVDTLRDGGWASAALDSVPL